MTPGPRFSATISASRISRRAISLPSSVRRLTTVLRLLLFSSRKKKLSRLGLSAFHSRRARSPWGGRSILITSAPSHASIWVQEGPAWSCVKSITRMPSRAWLILILLIARRQLCFRNPGSAQAFSQAFAEFTGWRQILLHPREREARPELQQCLPCFGCCGQIALHGQPARLQEKCPEILRKFRGHSARPDDAISVALGPETGHRGCQRGEIPDIPVARAEPQRVLRALCCLVVSPQTNKCRTEIGMSQREVGVQLQGPAQGTCSIVEAA